MGQLKASEKLERLLAIIPWIMDNDGPKLETVAQRFEYPKELLLSDLTKVIFMVGPYPHTPDTLIEVLVEDGRVWIDQAEWLERPLRLTAEQGFSLLRRAKTVEIIHGRDDDSALSRAIAKLEKSLGQSRETFELDIPELKNSESRLINESIEKKTQLRIRYYAYSKDQSSVRTVHPIEVVNRDHSHYLHAYCSTANDYRLFRLDRIMEAHATEQPNDIPEGDQDLTGVNEQWNLDNETSEVLMQITPADSWILSAYPIKDFSYTDDDYIEVRLVVSGVAWLKRLLLRLSPETKILESPDHLPKDLAKETALSITNRYKENL